MSRQRLVTIICVVIIVGGIASLYPLQKSYDQTLGANPVLDETLYLTNGETVKKLSLGFDGAVSDLYWIRTVQYFGRKLFGGLGGSFDESKLNEKDMKLLNPMLNIVVTIDPQYMVAYSYGATFLGEFNLDAASQLLNRGIREAQAEFARNPQDEDLRWNLCRLYSQLGYTYWRAKRFNEASKAYEDGSKVPRSPAWMKHMATVMKIQGGDRAVGYIVLTQQLQEAEDETIRSSIDWRLRHLRSQDERDFLNRMVNVYQAKNGHCPTNLTQLLPLIREHQQTARDALGRSLLETMRFENGLPMDPGEPAMPYELNPQTCLVDLNAQSTIPKRWDKN